MHLLCIAPEVRDILDAFAVHFDSSNSIVRKNEQIADHAARIHLHCLQHCIFMFVILLLVISLDTF